MATSHSTADGSASAAPTWDRSPQQRARLGLGRTFQGGRLFPGLTVAETVAVALERTTTVHNLVDPALRLPASIDDEVQVARRVGELLELFHLEAYREHLSSELSTGTRRVVEFACAVAHQPEVLLLDEPAAGVAQREVEQLGELLVRIRDELGCAMVVIEHDMPLLAGISDRLVSCSRWARWSSRATHSGCSPMSASSRPTSATISPQWGDPARCPADRRPAD